MQLPHTEPNEIRLIFCRFPLHQRELHKRGFPAKGRTHFLRECLYKAITYISLKQTLGLDGKLPSKMLEVQIPMKVIYI